MRALNLGKLCPCSLLAVEITSAQPSPSSRNPSMSYKGSVVVEPRQLVPYVGKIRAGITISPAPNSANCNSSTSTTPITCGLQDSQNIRATYIPTTTRNSYRRSLRWKDDKLSLLQAVKISTDSDGQISLADSYTEALSEP